MLSYIAGTSEISEGVSTQGTRMGNSNAKYVNLESTDISCMHMLNVLVFSQLTNILSILSKCDADVKSFPICHSEELFPTCKLFCCATFGAST